MDVELGLLVASDVSRNFNRFLLCIKTTGYPVGASFTYGPLAIAWNDVLTLSRHWSVPSHVGHREERSYEVQASVSIVQVVGRPTTGTRRCRRGRTPSCAGLHCWRRSRSESAAWPTAWSARHLRSNQWRESRSGLFASRRRWHATWMSVAFSQKIRAGERTVTVAAG